MAEVGVRLTVAPRTADDRGATKALVGVAHAASVAAMARMDFMVVGWTRRLG